MTTAYLADTGVFVRCGGPDVDKYRRLRGAVRRAGVSLIVPRRVSLELSGSGEPYPSNESPWRTGIEEGWIVVAN